MRRLIVVAGLTLLTGAAAGCGDEKSPSGCEKDTDCKGRRICEKGSCVNPQPPPKASGPRTPPATRPGGPRSGPSAGTPSAPPSAPGHGLTPPSAPGAPGSGAAGPLPALKICIGKQCMAIGPSFGQNPGQMAKLFELARRLFLQSLSGSGSRGPQDKIKVCIRSQCVTLDENLKKDPTALFRVLGQLAPGLIQRLFQGGLGQGLFGPRPPRGQQPPTAPAPRGTGRPSARPGPTSGQLLTDYAAITRAGAHAAGKEAQLAGLTITSVAADRLVLEGPGKEMIVLKIPPDKRSLVPRLRTTTAKVTVRFRILSPPVGKILHGALIAVK